MKLRTKILFITLVYYCMVSFATAGVLERYVEQGCNNNLALKQREFSLQVSMQALKEAKGMFLPAITIEGRFSVAGGGRVIDFPIGDMLNPLHSTLNQLLMLHGYAPAFPTDISNEQFPFLRPMEHETKIRVVQPVFQPGIYYNVKIKRDMTRIEKAGLEVFKQQLIADIKTAFFTYLKTVKVKELLDHTAGLLAENLSLSESLFQNDKVTGEVVSRSKAEIGKLERQRAEAGKNCRMAAAYFNFLLNRSLDADIETTGYDGEPGFTELDLAALTRQALERRSEFHQVANAMAAAGHAVKLHKAAVLPTVSAVFDYGFQGEKYSFTGADDYWMGSVLFSWNLFRGGQDRAKKKQALYQRESLQAQKTELEKQIVLQVQDAFYSLEVARKAIISSETVFESSQEAFRIVDKKYRQGMVPQIEYTQARNDFTTAGIEHIVAIYDYYIKEAELRKVCGGGIGTQQE